MAIQFANDDTTITGAAFEPPSRLVENPKTKPKTTLVPQNQPHPDREQVYRKPLEYTGSLDEYKSIDLTPVIGREYPSLQLSEILNDDIKIRDLAITGTVSVSPEYNV